MKRQTFWSLTFVLICLLTAVTTLLMSGELSSSEAQTHESDIIMVERLSDLSALITISGCNTVDSMYVEVEYPDPDYTLEEELNYEIQYAIGELKELHQ